MSYRHFYKDKWSVHIWHVYILWPFFIKKDTEEVFYINKVQVEEMNWKRSVVILELVDHEK